MKSLLLKLRSKALGLSRAQVDFHRRGFCGATNLMRVRLEQIGGAFVDGYNLGLAGASIPALGRQLGSMENELQGFAYEGAAMALGLLDTMTPWKTSRVESLLNGPGADHKYMIHVGLGWAWARFPLGFRRRQARLDSVLGWLALDGWGFHEGFFHWQRCQGGQIPGSLRGFETRVFDQGLGRSLWFVKGGNVEMMVDTIFRFDAGRQPDLWSGIGLAATCAGVLDLEGLHRLRKAAGIFSPCLAQGSAFAAKVRVCAGNLTNYTDMASHVLCGMSAMESAKMTDEALENIPSLAPEPAYEIWRQRIQHRFTLTTKSRQF